MKTKRALFFALLASLLGFSGEVFAQAKKEPTKAKKVIRLEDIVIEGRIQKPQAFYIIQRSNLNFEGLELKESLLPKIVKAVDGEPF